MKKLALFLLVATLAIGLTGCNQAVHGGGQLTLMEQVPWDGEWGWRDYGTAQFAISAMCNDKKDAVMANIEWNDQTNGVHFHARMPWTSLSEVSEGTISTCEDLAVIGQDFDGSAAVGYINEQGQEVGMVQIILAKPGESLPYVSGDPCGGTAPSVLVQAEGGAVPDAWSYQAVGCLARGNIVWQ